MKLVVIGNGIAAQAAVENYRKLNTADEITILTEEPYLTYQRIKLSHYLGKTDFTEDELLVKPSDWYATNRVEVHLNTHVKNIDFNAKWITTSTGEKFVYNKLLLATGGHAFMPPILGSNQKGVFSLRTLDDLKAIQSYIKEKKRVLIIGGGLLGLEAAQGLIELGKKVDVLEFFPYLLPRQMDGELSKVVQEQLEREGMVFYLNQTCEEILGENGCVSGVRLGDGSTLKTDAIIVSAGVRPNLDLFHATNLEVNKGIVVNDHMETNLPDVYAAGDVAEYNGVVYGLWVASNEQGRIAGSNLAGKEMVYSAPQLVTTLGIGEVKVFSIGDVSQPESTITYRDATQFHRLYIKENCVVGAVLTGDLSFMLKAKKAVVAHKEVPLSTNGNTEEELFIMLLA